MLRATRARADAAIRKRSLRASRASISRRPASPSRVRRSRVDRATRASRTRSSTRPTRSPKSASSTPLLRVRSRHLRLRFFVSRDSDLWCASRMWRAALVQLHRVHHWLERSKLREVRNECVCSLSCVFRMLSGVCFCVL